ncbi:MAG TPA: DNA polymerase III subunit delta [Patescibacteria group bacterium]
MLIFLYGEDSFRSSQKLLQIKEKFLATDLASAGLSVFDYDPTSTREDSSTRGGRRAKLLDILGMSNLLNPKRLVIIKNLISSAGELEREEVLNYFKKNTSVAEDVNLVVVFFENSLPKKNSAVFKFLDKNAKSQNFEKMSALKINQWVLRRFKELDPEASIANSALEKLVVFSGGDMYILNSEIQKLINFANGVRISDVDVETLVNSNINIKIFDTIDALGNNNKKQASRLLHEHLKKGEDPFYLFSMFIYQFRNLLKVADLKENNGISEYEISKIAGIHPFVVKKSLAQIRNFSLKRLKNIYQQLAELDTKIKTGKIDIRLALDKFLIEL